MLEGKKAHVCSPPPPFLPPPLCWLMCLQPPRQLARAKGAGVGVWTAPRLSGN